MGKVIWSPAALDDVDGIAEYIARDSPDRAAAFADRLVNATHRLADFPHSGRVIPESRSPDRREIPVGSYRILYLTQGDDVWVTRVVHGARDLTSE